MQNLYNLIYDRSGKEPASKPAHLADEQPTKNDRILRTKLKGKRCVLLLDCDYS
jgi:hypothetical protein